MNDRVYSSREQNASRLSITCNRAQLQSHDSSNSIISNPTSSSSSSSSSSNLSNLSLSDIEEADQLPASASTVRAANVSEDATGNRPSSSRPPARTAYSGLSTVGIGFRGFQNTILSPAQRIAKDSLPSPPATNREGESEQGSIGSARGQTSARREHGNSNTRSTTATQSHMPSDKRLTDAYATIRRSPVNATLADQQAYPNLVTAEHDTHHAQNTYQFNASSSAGRSPLTYSRSSSSSANTRSRSVSPLATLVDLPSTSNLHRSSPREPSNTGSNKVKDTRSSEFREDLSHNASQLSRTSSTSSHTSQVISSMADLKGKGREIAPTSVERKPSISASKIREASKASRARVRHVSDLIWCEAIADMRPELYSTSEPASEAPSPPAQNNPGQPRYSVSPQSSRTSLSRPTSASPQQSTQTLETAARLSPIDGRLPIHDSSPSSSTSRNSIPGSDAFVTSKRNSMISLASRAGEDIHSLPHSTGTMNGLSKLASKEVGDRSLEEGEILEETPPVGIERVYSHETRRQSNSQIRTIDQERRDEVPRHSRHKDVDDSFQYAARLSRPTGYTSLPATEDLTARSTTPSPLHGVGKLLVSPTEDNEDRRSSYSHRNTPHRTSAARSDSSRPSTAGSSTTREQRESRYSTNGKTGEHEDDTSRTPRRTPFHRRYESEARFRSNHSSRVDPALDITSDRQDPRFAAEGRPHSSLLRHSVEPSDDSRSRGSTDGRRKVYSSQDDGYTHDTHDLRRSHSVISNAHRGSGQSAYSTRSNRTSYLQAESSVDQGRHSSERHYSRAPPSQDRQHSYSETGRTTPRLRERPASRVGQSSSAVSGSHSVRNISDQLGRSNDLSSDQRARRRTLSDGLDRSLSRPASQADVFVDTSRGAPDSKQQFSTLPSSASRSRVSLRNLEVASPDWWREVSEIRDKANNASADRPLSRASNHRSLASLTSPESSAARSERNRTPAGRLASMASSMSPKGYTGRTDSRRSTARDGQDHADRPYTPYKASPSRPASRSTYHHHQYPSATDQAWVTREVGEESHYGLLREALHSVRELQWQHSGLDEQYLLEFERIAGLLVDTAIRQNSLTASLWKDAANVRVESELASDSETNTHAAKNRYDKFVSRFERLSATTRRLSEEQVRSLTELFLLLGKQQKSPRSISTGHEIPLLNSEKQVASSPIRRSATLPSSSRGQYHRPDETGTIRTPANARRPPYVNTLERIDSMVDDDPPSDKRPARSTRAESSVPSPRALQRAKSTSTSQVSQNTVKGYVTSSPTKDAGGYFPVLPNGLEAAKRSSSRASQRSHDSPSASQISVSESQDFATANGDTSAVSRLESQLAGTSGSAASQRWRRPFSSRRQLPDAHVDELPDSPAAVAHPGNRSSELARTLSRMSSRVLRQ